MRALTKAEAILWARKETWTIDQAAMLISGISPDRYKQLYDAAHDEWSICSREEELAAMLPYREASDVARPILEVLKLRLPDAETPSGWISLAAAYELEVPDVLKAAVKAETKQRHTTNLIAGSDKNSWIESARSLAVEYISRHKKQNLFPTQKDVSAYIAVEFRNRRITGPTGRPMEATYIQRNAIQGNWWQAHKP